LKPPINLSKTYLPNVKWSDGKKKKGWKATPKKKKFNTGFSGK
jgi:hypothetical protein